MFLDGRDTFNTIQEGVGILLDFPVTVGSVENSTESLPIAGCGIYMQLPIGVDGLRGIKQIFHELTA